MIKTITEVINGNEYVITTFDAIRGNLILFKLIKYLRGGTSLFDSLSKNSNFLDSEISIGTALESILANMNPEELNDFVIMMLKSTSYKDKPLTSDIIKQHFAGNYLEMYRLLVAIIKANYINEGAKSFFDQVRHLTTTVAEQKQANTKSTQKN